MDETVENQQADTAKDEVLDRGDAFTPDDSKGVDTEGEAIDKKVDDAGEKDDADKGDEKDGADKGDEKDDADKGDEKDDADKGDEKDDEPNPVQRDRDENGKFVKGKEPLIPKSRFDKAGQNAARKIEALQRRVLDLTTELVASNSGDTAALEAQLDEKNATYTKLLSDGELEQATALKKDIDRINRKLAVAESAQISSTQTTAAHGETALRDLIAIYEEEYPVLDKNNDGKDQAVIDWVNAKFGLYQKAGLSGPAALKEAVEDAAARFKLVGVTEGEAEPGATKAVKDAARKTEAVKKNVDTAKRQPAKTDGVGQDSDKAGAAKTAVHELSMADFDKLPETVIRRARGDIV